MSPSRRIWAATYDKTQRVQRLCSWLSEILKQSGIAVRPGVIHKAACLSKTDLTTELVKEFTELQGIVGGLYARVQQLDRVLPEATRFAIADAIYDHYKPESTDDDVPRSIEGAVLSIGDKADTIAGMFALGLVPSGSKDPFALRRQANAIVKVIAEKKLPLRLSELMRDARAGYQKSEAEKKFVDEGKYAESIRCFFRERLEFYLKDVCGYAYDVVKAVLARGCGRCRGCDARAEAVKQVLHMPEFQAIGAACKRMRNILRQAEEKGITPAAKFDALPILREEEKNLAAYVESTGPKVEAHRKEKEYGDALRLLATAREPVDAFFDKVMVMVDDERAAGESAGAAADAAEGIFHDRGFLRDCDGREGVEVCVRSDEQDSLAPETRALGMSICAMTASFDDRRRSRSTTRI